MLKIITDKNENASVQMKLPQSAQIGTELTEATGNKETIDARAERLALGALPSNGDAPQISRNSACSLSAV